MLTKQPFLAIQLFDRLDLHDSIFSINVNPPRQDALATAQILDHLSSDWSTDEYLWFAAALAPFRDLVIKTKKDVPAVAAVISDGIKVGRLGREVRVDLFSFRMKSRPTL